MSRGARQEHGPESEQNTRWVAWAGPNAVACGPLRWGAETSQISCNVLRALGANGHRHIRRVARCELEHAGGTGRTNMLRHLQEWLRRSGQGRLRAACGRVAWPRTLESMPPNRNLE